MNRYWEMDEGYQQPSASQIKKNAAASLNKAKMKGRKPKPVAVSGSRIAKSWWGRAWCENLERYADYENRLERGKRYVRTGAVIDLEIKKGKVTARVQGRRKTPYKVEVRISPLSEARCQAAILQCGKKIENLEYLIKGSFSEELKTLFTGNQGLFPTPKEIGFSCSCPDWALMCKHVAAVLYGIGVQFDKDPLLFFELRGIDVGRFVDVALENRVELMLKNAEMPSERIIQNADMESLFGVR